MSVYFVNLGVLTEKRFVVYRRGEKSKTEMLELYWIECSSKAVEYSTILILFFFQCMKNHPLLAITKRKITTFYI